MATCKPVLDRREVDRMYPAGTRLYCPKNKTFYQIGVRVRQQYWMMSEGSASRGLVDAHTILADFERVKP